MADQPLILIVDDDPSFRDIFRTSLSAHGYRIETAENGEEGIAKAKQLKPNLILMDVHMPGMDGATAVLKLREDPETKAMKIVFLTSLGDPQDDMLQINEKFSKDFGSQGYLKKTDDLETLAEKVKTFLS